MKERYAMKVFIVMNSGNVDSVWARSADAMNRNRTILRSKGIIAAKDSAWRENVIAKRVR